ncbi:hypothetical protein EXN66_Car009710 [Channa argus]|uniref:Uncharacterized protein n=1 Tax=Channa argus TaxID=215402 RepID=A0A6G1PV71_CHAAH|nr:hypothetical protein EXN66_Car009710 [Channa argus]
MYGYFAFSYFHTFNMHICPSFFYMHAHILPFSTSPLSLYVTMKWSHTLMPCDTPDKFKSHSHGLPPNKHKYSHAFELSVVSQACPIFKTCKHTYTHSPMIGHTHCG